MQQRTTAHPREFKFLRFLNSPKMQRGPLAWGIILGSILLFLLPYAFPGATYRSLDAYGMFVLVPITIAAYLRPRGVSVLVSGICTGCLAIKISFDSGLFHPWLPLTLISFLLGAFFSLVYGLVVSKFRLMSIELTKANEHIRMLALSDGLTGVLNRRTVMDTFEQKMQDAIANEEELSLIFFDADHFKQINDTYGHASGDVVLCELAARASNVVCADDVLGRMGGEEFLLVLPNTGTIEAGRIAERLRATVAATSIHAAKIEEPIAVTVSVGVATYPVDGCDYSELLTQADMAMYRAKQLGRNRVCVAQGREHIQAGAIAG